jgi:hypothetical protein
MVFAKSSLFESSRHVHSSSSKEHWRSGSSTPQGYVALFGPLGGIDVGGMVSALLDIVEVGTRAIQEGCGSPTTHKVCNPSWIDGVSLIRPPQHF